ncbi:hypothetical protein QT336_27600 (plasmid) [Escherichia coli]|nr:hypothetical protein [Escherichia coli]MDM4829446.1 hypothetical protein [Escherichia coli]
MKKVVLMALALGLSLPAMASEKVIDMYKSENCGCCCNITGLSKSCPTK